MEFFTKKGQVRMALAVASRTKSKGQAHPDARNACKCIFSELGQSMRRTIVQSLRLATRIKRKGKTAVLIPGRPRGAVESPVGRGTSPRPPGLTFSGPRGPRLALLHPETGFIKSPSQ